MVSRRHIRSRAIEEIYSFCVNESVSYSLGVDRIVSDLGFHELYFKSDSAEKVNVEEIVGLFDRLVRCEKGVKYEGMYFTQILNDSLNSYKDEMMGHLLSLKNGLVVEIEHVYNLYMLLFLVLVDKRSDRLTAKNFFVQLIKSRSSDLDGLYSRPDFWEMLITSLYDVVLDKDEIIAQYENLVNNRVNSRGVNNRVDNSKKDDIKLLKYIVRDVLLKHNSALDILDQNLINVKKYRSVVFDIFMNSLKSIGSLDGDVSSIFSSIFSRKYVEGMYDVSFYGSLIENFLSNRLHYDELINSRAKNHDIEKVGLLDKIIISLALCEVFCFEDIPTNVSINEYVAISKRYCSVHSTRFINGMIDGIVSSHVECV
jgi:transcription termination factor NusB